MIILSGNLEWEWVGLDIPEYEDHVTKRVRAAHKKLKPGMRVRNGNTRTIGMLVADKDNPKKLKLGVWLFVAVKTRIKSGKNIGQSDIRLWQLTHIQIPVRTR